MSIPSFQNNAVEPLQIPPANFTGDPLQVTQAFAGLLRLLGPWSQKVAALLNRLIPSGGSGFTPANAVLLTGTTPAGPLQVAGDWTISGSTVTGNGNAAALPATASNGVMIHLGNADATATRIFIDVFASNPAVTMRRANGTNAIPSGLLSGDNFLTLDGRGYGTTAYTSQNAVITYTAQENWTDTAQGSKVLVSAVPKGSPTSSVGLVATFQAAGDGGQVLVGNTSGTGVASGNVGFYTSNIVLVANEVSINSSTNVCTLTNLPAGDWDVWGELWVDTSTGAATVSGRTAASITQSSATNVTVPADNGARATVTYAPNASSTTAMVIPVGPVRIIQSAAANVYLVGACQVSAGTANGYGKLCARLRQ